MMLKFHLNATVQIVFAGLLMLAGCLHQPVDFGSGSEGSTEIDDSRESDQQEEIQTDQKKVDEFESDGKQE